MKNLINFQTDLVESIKLNDLLESARPQSVQGAAFRTDWLNGLKTASLNLRLLNSFLAESGKFTDTDPAIKELYTEVYSALNKTPIKSKLAFMLEYSDKGTDNEFVKLFRENLEKIIALEEAEIVGKIKNGILDNFSNVPGMLSILTEAKGNVQVAEGNKVNLYHPLSYVGESEGKTFIRFGNKVLEFSENSLSYGKSPSAKFTNMSNIVEHVKNFYDQESESFKLDTGFGKFVVGESGMTVNGDAIANEQFMKRVGVIIESHDRNVRDHERKQADILIALSENFESIVEADNLLIAENRNFSENIGLIKHDNKLAVVVFESNRYPETFETFESISEAVNRFEFLTGTKVAERYSEDIENEKIRTDESLKMISLKKDEIKKVDEKIKEIRSDFAIVEKGSEAFEKLEEVLEQVEELKMNLEKELNDLL